MEVVNELGVEDVAIIGIAKGPHHGRDGREVFHFPDGREKMLPVNSPVLFHLQRLRDEVHRFVIGAHRDKRSRAITASPWTRSPASVRPASARCCCISARRAGCGRRLWTIWCGRRGCRKPWRGRCMISIIRG
jgi:excinuclease ABC subunit C